MAASDVSSVLKKALDPGVTYREKSLSGVDPESILRTVRTGKAGDRPVTDVTESYVDALKNYLIKKAMQKLDRPVI